MLALSNQSNQSNHGVTTKPHCFKFNTGTSGELKKIQKEMENKSVSTIHLMFNMKLPFQECPTLQSNDSKKVSFDISYKTLCL